MKTVFENEFIKIDFDSSNSLMETVWTTTVAMSREKYRETVKLYIEQVQANRPKKILIDSRTAEYMVDPEDQDWINIHIYPQTVEAGTNKIAILVGTDLFMNTSLEQTVEDSKESSAKGIKQSFFDDYYKALSWLNQND